MSDRSLPQTPDQIAPTSTLGQLRQHLEYRPQWLMSLGVAGLCLVVGVSIVRSQLLAQEPGSAVVNAAEALSVETLTVEAVNSYAVSRSYTGAIAALRSSDLGFNRGGELVQVLVSEGDRVTSGQPLAQLDTQNLQTQRRQLEAQKAEAEARLLELERGARQEDIAAARAQVRDLESQLQLQEIQRSRRATLYEQGAISKEQLDEFVFGAETLNARLDQANSNLNELLNGTRPEQIAAQRAVVQQLDASLADVDVDISKSTLKAPFDGIVSTQQVDEGAVVGAGQSVVRLIENGAPEARIGIPETAASRIQVGDPVTVNLGPEGYRAIAQAVLPEVDPNTRTQIVIFQIEPTALANVNPGQTVRVDLTETIPVGGIWLPMAALTQDLRGLWSTYVIMPTDPARTDPGAANGAATPYIVQPKSVEILHQESDRVLVQGTLQAGDRIVSSGIHRLVPGQAVRPIE